MLTEETLDSFNNFYGFLSEIGSPCLDLSGGRKIPSQIWIKFDNELPFIELRQFVNHTTAIPWTGYAESTGANLPHTLILPTQFEEETSVAGLEEFAQVIERTFLSRQPGSLGYRLMSPDALARETGLDSGLVLRALVANPERFRKSALSSIYKKPIYALRSFPINWKEHWAIVRWYMGLPFGWGIG